ncbi:diguanylate cyclase, partial [Shigella flexneri]
EEKERQIASILSWEIDIIYKVLLDSDLGSSLPLSQADFGLWFNDIILAALPKWAISPV